MEIEYSKFEVDPKVFGKKTITGIYDLDGDYIYKNLYKIEKLKINNKLTVRAFLLLNSTTKSKYLLAKNLLDDFEITNIKRKKRLKDLAFGDYLKVLIIKMVLNSSKTIILKNIEISFTSRELSNIFNALRRNLKNTKKRIIYITKNVETLVLNTDYYVITKNNKMIYSGDDINSLPIKTESMEIVDLANKKGAKLKYYKDINDLLKAIYKSVEK